MVRDSRLRTIIKTLTWRFIGTTITFILAFSIFSNIGCHQIFERALMVAGMDLLLKTLFFYAHERAWQMIPKQLVKRFLNFVK